MHRFFNFILPFLTVLIHMRALLYISDYAYQTRRTVNYLTFFTGTPAAILDTWLLKK